jgi:hypothetical protein
MPQQYTPEYINDLLLMAEQLVELAIYRAIQTQRVQPDPTLAKFEDKAEQVYKEFVNLRRILRTPWRPLSPEFSDKYYEMLKGDE